MFGITKPHQINWTTTLFLGGTFLVGVIGTPLYLWAYGWSWFLFAYFMFMFVAAAMSITLGYHRLFAHNAFKAAWPVKAVTLLFGAAAFENSALLWASEHRRHHKHVDHDDDPYDISKGFWYAHIGWLFLRYIPSIPLDNVADLRKDKWVMFQHNYVQRIAFVVSFLIPMLVGWFWHGAQGLLGCLIIVGFLRVVCVHHVTFFINSLCHTLGNQPYSARCSARDSWLMALLTFGEGYHNYHHEFQHDYRNGVQRWQWDPTKWAIWLMQHVGLTHDLRRVPNEKIMLAQIAEKERALRTRLETKTETLSEAGQRVLENARAQLHHAAEAWEARRQAYLRATEANLEHTREQLKELLRELREATRHLRQSMREWHQAYRMAARELVPAGAAA